MLLVALEHWGCLGEDRVKMASKLDLGQGLRVGVAPIHRGMHLPEVNNASCACLANVVPGDVALFLLQFSSWVAGAEKLP